MRAPLALLLSIAAREQVASREVMYDDAFVDGVFSGLRAGSFTTAQLMASFESAGSVPAPIRDAALQHQPALAGRASHRVLQDAIQHAAESPRGQVAAGGLSHIKGQLREVQPRAS